ncbi:hypothetical protein [Aquabacterium sp.]|uniref:hypothetical protein n=1 Tax=Aquabacterium sp. TaxID=1872578 RepID=UPI0037852EF3
MPTLHLLTLTCVRTQQTHDQAYVRTAAEVRGSDGGLHPSIDTTDARRMHDGTSILLDRAIEFETHAEVQVWEQDNVGRNDPLGSFRVDRAWINMGEWTQDIHRRQAHYVVTFEATSGHARPLDYEIEILGLHCVDAQQAHDHVFLKINGETVLEPTRMRTGDRREALGIRRRFHRNVFVDLWEEDAGGHGSDHLGRMTLLLAEVQAQLPGGARSYRISQHSAEGSATYELSYDLRR